MQIRRSQKSRFRPSPSRAVGALSCPHPTVAPGEESEVIAAQGATRRGGLPHRLASDSIVLGQSDFYERPLLIVERTPVRHAIKKFQIDREANGTPKGTPRCNKCSLKNNDLFHSCHSLLYTMLCTCKAVKRQFRLPRVSAPFNPDSIGRVRRPSMRPFKASVSRSGASCFEKERYGKPKLFRAEKDAVDPIAFLNSGV